MAATAGAGAAEYHVFQAAHQATTIVGRWRLCGHVCGRVCGGICGRVCGRVCRSLPARGGLGFVGHAGAVGGCRGGIRSCRAGGGAALQPLIGRLSVDRFFIHPGHQRLRHQRLPLGGVDRPDLAARGQHKYPLGDAGPAFFVQKTHQRLAHTQLGDRGLDIQRRIGAHRAGRRLYRLLVTRREGAQRMLHPVAQLAQHGVGQIQRVLGHEVHPHAFAANQAHHQLNAFDQGGGCVFEQQVRLVEKKHQFGLVQVTDLGQQLKQLGQHPQQKRGVQPGRVHQLVGAQDVDHALAVTGLEKIAEVEHRLAEKHITALLLDLQQPALYRANRRRADVAVFGGEVAGVVAHMLEHGAQVFQIQQQQAVVVGNLEHQVQHTGLGFIQGQHARQQQRAHVRCGGAHRVAGLAKYIPQRNRAGQRCGRGQATLGQQRSQLDADGTGLADTGQITFDIGHEDRHAQARKVFGQGLQGDGLAGAGGPGDQAMAVGQRGQQTAFNGAVAGYNNRVGHWRGSVRRFGWGQWCLPPRCCMQGGGAVALQVAGSDWQ